MADYNSLNLPLTVGTRVKTDSGIETDRASNGAVRARSLYSNDKRTFTLKHVMLNATQRAALNAFYTDYKTTINSFSFDGTSYSVIFGDAPQYDYVGANYADASVELIEV